MIATVRLCRVHDKPDRWCGPKGPRVFARHGPEFKAIGAPASNVPPMLLALADEAM